MKLRDKNGSEITWRDMVIVDEPRVDSTDLHSYSFVGEVTDVIDTKGVVVVDDVYEIEAERVVLV